MQVRACWSALENKAERKITRIREDTARAQELRQSLLASQAKLEQMYQEYYEKNAANSSYKGMTDAMNQRQFMSQLQTLHNRVEADIERTMAHQTALQAALREADTERLKMKTLRENAQALHNKEVARQEQHAMDALGVQQYNRKAA